MSKYDNDSPLENQGSIRFLSLKLSFLRAALLKSHSCAMQWLRLPCYSAPVILMLWTESVVVGQVDERRYPPSGDFCPCSITMFRPKRDPSAFKMIPPPTWCHFFLVLLDEFSLLHFKNGHIISLQVGIFRAFHPRVLLVLHCSPIAFNPRVPLGITLLTNLSCNISLDCLCCRDAYKVMLVCKWI